jgi:hypothetical protein
VRGGVAKRSHGEAVKRNEWELEISVSLEKVRISGGAGRLVVGPALLGMKLAKLSFDATLRRCLRQCSEVLSAPLLLLLVTHYSTITV